MSHEKKIMESHWYRPSLTGLTLLLLPFSWLFGFIIAIRRFLYNHNFLRKKNYSIPVIVVGNLTVGGTGKTPFVIWLAELLQKKGFRPGIVSRGVGGKKLTRPCWVDVNANPAHVGDEAVLLAKRTACPMVACIDRVAAVDELLKKTNCNIVISDDGLQHYKLGRSLEVVIVDGVREFGNAQLLPAGPLREPLKRLQQVDYIVINGSADCQHPILKSEKIIKKIERMILSGDVLSTVQPSDKKLMLQNLQEKTVHAIAGVGNPQRFFSALRDHNINVIEHEFADHYLYQREDIYFCDDLPIIMTEKDAVKCIGFADERHWYLPVSAEMSDGFMKN